MIKILSTIKPKIASTSLRNNFVKSTLPSLTRMASSAAQNEDLKSSKLFDVSNYSAVVTGGGTGIGLMITQTLVANGAKVYITGRRKEALDTVVQKYNTGPGKIVAYVTLVEMLEDGTLIVIGSREMLLRKMKSSFLLLRLRRMSLKVSSCLSTMQASLETTTPNTRPDLQTSR